LRGTIDRYIRYYVNQSGSREIGPVYRASFRVQIGNVIGSFFRGLFRFIKSLLYSGAKAVGKEALTTVSNKITDILNNDLEQNVDNIFRIRFCETKGKLEEKFKKMAESSLC